MTSRWNGRWAIPLSIAAHAVVVGVLLLSLPVPQFVVPDDPVVTVELVPAPEEEAAEPAAEVPQEEQVAEPEMPEAETETPTAEATEPEAAETGETAEEAQEEAQEEAANPQPPASETPPEPPAEPEAEEPSPPEETAQPEQPETEQPETEQIEAGQAEEAQSPPGGEAGSEETDQGDLQRLRALRPVFQFGEDDAGPRVEEDGDAAVDSGQTPEIPESRSDPASDAVATLVPEPEPKPAEVERLYSTTETGGPLATTAMGSLSRGKRGAELCASELREQLRHASPELWPELLPAYRLGAGTTIEVDEGAFRAGGRWYELAYRCEVDEAVTRVVSFAFDVGSAIPRDQWRARGFPDF